MKVTADFQPYPNGLQEMRIPLEDEKYLIFKINKANPPENEEDEVETQSTSLRLHDTFEILYFDSIEEVSLLELEKTEATTLHTIIRDFVRLMDK
ncbi:hypothetical protein [Halalkalibacter oceani]|uniref:hypothetical protein n=1 Tax=Halalkalibacter oceani TaxID=1653776 RepID=UPI00339413F2